MYLAFEGHGRVVGVRTWHLRAMAGWLGYVPGIEGHGGVVGVLGEVQVGGPPQLFLYDQGLLQQLETSCQELVLHFQEVPCTRCVTASVTTSKRNM